MTIAISLVIGAVMGAGLWLLVSAVPIMRRPQLMHRVAPYVLDVSQGARDLVARRTVNPLQIFRVAGGPVLDPLSGIVGSILGGNQSLAIRLRQAGDRRTVDEFRRRQLSWALVGGAAGLAIGIVLAARGAGALIPAFLAPVAALLAAMAAERLLQERARRRVERITEELPTVLEFVSLALAAGESLADALRRVASRGSGELPGELARVMHAHAAGQPLAEALEELSRELAHPPITRFVDQLRVALDRGAPLAGVLQAQASDVRDEAKRRLLESAGKKEIVMLVPLVFGLLPVTIAFALWPGLHVLQVGL